MSRAHSTRLPAFHKSESHGVDDAYADEDRQQRSDQPRRYPNAQTDDENHADR